MSDILDGQVTDAAALAELYDLEHDEVTDDLGFWREMVRHRPGPVLDLGCGSGRLLRALLDAGAAPLVGVDGSAALLARARDRILGDPVLRAAAADRRLAVMPADARHPLDAEVAAMGPFRLVVAAGLVPHLEGYDALAGMLRALAPLVAGDGRIVIDDLGPAHLPTANLPLSVDWVRECGDERVERRSRLARWDEADGLRVAYATITVRRRADGTIRSLPARFRLWYPSIVSIERAAAAAGLLIDLVWGSYELDPYDPIDGERRIAVIRPAGTSMPGRSRP